MRSSSAMQAGQPYIGGSIPRDETDPSRITRSPARRPCRRHRPAAHWPPPAPDCPGPGGSRDGSHGAARQSGQFTARAQMSFSSTALPSPHTDFNSRVRPGSSSGPMSLCTVMTSSPTVPGAHSPISSGRVFALISPPSAVANESCRLPPVAAPSLPVRRKHCGFHAPRPLWSRVLHPQARSTLRCGWFAISSLQLRTVTKFPAAYADARCRDSAPHTSHPSTGTGSRAGV